MEAGVKSNTVRGARKSELGRNDDIFHTFRSILCKIKLLWYIEPLLSSDSVKSGRCYVSPATYKHAAIEERCFLCYPRRDNCNGMSL
jgi:hypothetical protein